MTPYCMINLPLPSKKFHRQPLSHGFAPPGSLSSRLNLTITGWGKMNYEGYDGDDFHRGQTGQQGSNGMLGRVARLQEGVVPIISRAECGDAKVRRLALGRFPEMRV